MCRHTQNNPDPQAIAASLRQLGVSIFAVGVPGINGCLQPTDVQELNGITGSPSRVIVVTDPVQLPQYVVLMTLTNIHHF
jgi:hypothetical protein